MASGFELIFDRRRKPRERDPDFFNRPRQPAPLDKDPLDRGRHEEVVIGTMQRRWPANLERQVDAGARVGGRGSSA